jgi:hypothetical protein
VYWGARRSVKEQFRTVEVGYRRSTIAPANPKGQPAALVNLFVVEPSGEAETLGRFEWPAEGTTGRGLLC